MIDVRAINHVGIRVRDLARARAFYTSFGFEFVVGPVGPEPVAIMRHPCGIVLNFILNGDQTTDHNVLMDASDKPSGYTHMALEVPDLDAAIATLESIGVPLSGGPVDVGNARFAFVRDPDRNVVELNQPKAGAAGSHRH